jgi:calcineurin-like phosphoesterase family protein
MNETIINNWKNTVGDDDIIWNLGDVANCELKADKDKMYELIHSLPGHKNLILGNHDKQDINYWHDIGFEFVSAYPIIYKDFFIMSHAPVFLNSSLPYGNIHGHVHCNSMADKCYYNVSVEGIGYMPIDLEIVMAKMVRGNV